MYLSEGGPWLIACFLAYILQLPSAFLRQMEGQAGQAVIPTTHEATHAFRSPSQYDNFA